MRTRTVLNKIGTSRRLGLILYVFTLYLFSFPSQSVTYQGQSSFGGHAAGIIRDVVVDEGSIFVGAENGLIQITGPSIIIYDGQNSPLGRGYISDLHEDEENNIWIAEYGGGLFVLDRKLGKIRELKIEKLSLEGVWSIEKSGDLLVIGLVGELIIYDTTSAKVVKQISNIDNQPITDSPVFAAIKNSHVAFATKEKFTILDLNNYSVISQPISEIRGFNPEVHHSPY